MEIWDKTTRDAFRETKLYKSTWNTWNSLIEDDDGNRLRFCNRRVIGHTMKLIRECSPRNFADWKNYYLKSGEAGDSALRHLNPFASRNMQKDETKNILIEHGRSKRQLCEIASKFKDVLKDRQNIDLTDEQALNCIVIRAVDETWIGYQRELAAEHEFNHICYKNGLTLRQTSDIDDIKHGCDFEIFKGDSLVCGIQVKGDGYLKGRSSPYTRYVWQAMDGYTELYHVPVIFACVDKHLEIPNAKRLETQILAEADKIPDRPAPARDTSLTIDQRRYFNKSKVRNPDGDLMKVYHGSPAKFTEFDPERIGSATGTAAGVGFNFTEDHALAEHYAEYMSKDGKGYIYPCYVDIHNPLSGDNISLSRKELVEIISSSLNPFWQANPVPKFLLADPEEYVYNLADTAMNYYRKNTDIRVLDIVSNAIADDFHKDPNCKKTMADILEKYYATPEGQTLKEANKKREKPLSDKEIFRNQILNLPYRIVMNDLGYDGYITHEADGNLIAVAMRPDQIKSVENLSPVRTSNDIFDHAEPVYEEVQEKRSLDDVISDAIKQAENCEHIDGRDPYRSYEKDFR